MLQCWPLAVVVDFSSFPWLIEKLPLSSRINFMAHRISKIFFDQRDYRLLEIVNDVLDRDPSLKHLKKLLAPYLHPHGIKEMAASTGLRIAYAVVHLLGSLEAGKAEDRLSALRSLRDEVLNIAHSPLRKNTARVLLQIMKELVRARGDEPRQLELAHDFRAAASGKPRVVRNQLRRYHLLEMPEEWNQIAFDDHVHDVNTKGRKSATHLIMDAWIKGIRHLTVVFYNYVPPEGAAELLEAAAIMGMTVRIGIEFLARFHNQYIKLIWVSRGFSDAQDFLKFLAKEPVKAFLAEGRKVSEYQQRYVMRIFQEFNTRHRLTINHRYRIDLVPLDESEFLSFVGAGQISILHLAKFIYKHILPAMQTRVESLRSVYAQAQKEEQTKIAGLVEEMNTIGSADIIEGYLQPDKNPNISDPNVPQDGPDVPKLLYILPWSLLEKLNRLRSGCQITLSLTNLRTEDVLELLYDCQGMITHLEIFNLKDYTTENVTHNQEINELQLAINKGNAIILKRIIRNIIDNIDASGESITLIEEKKKKIIDILCDIQTLQSYYKKTSLKSYIGSDSTGRSRHLYGMGMVIKDTLCRGAQKRLRHSFSPSYQSIPVSATVYLRTSYIPYAISNVFIRFICRLLNFLPALRFIGYKHQQDWLLQEYSLHMKTYGNIAILGGVQEKCNNGLYLEAPKTDHKKVPWKYLNTGLKNGLKVLVGFIPAFATFALTKDWWLLAWFGAFIWFGITGIRNIIQSVLGGGGIRRSPLLRWNDYISWQRITDSLLFTGFSVPLLDYVVKTLVLDQGLGITTTTSPTILYSLMALANGLYITTHNLFRGLPKNAAFGNFFRTILSIPIALGLNAGIGGILSIYGVIGVDTILQKWAAIISKLASDCVAGVIEGMADRYRNIRMRLWDYESKFTQIFNTYARLELLFPKADVLQMLESPKEFMRTISAEAGNLEKIIIINALDLLYFWMYQPRARSALCTLMRTMSFEERQILVRSQFVLQRQREISQIFVDGIVGKNFSKALSFYLDRSKEYLESMQQIADICIPKTDSIRK